MRTKNAKRLWPVPATLAAVAVAAFLAFGLMATTGAQPAAAQDDDPCITVTAGGEAIGSQEPTIPANTNNADGNQGCNAATTPAVVKLVGQAATDDAAVSNFVIYGPGIGGANTHVYPPDTDYGNHDNDPDTDDVFFTGNAPNGVKVSPLPAKAIQIGPGTVNLSGSTVGSSETFTVAGTAPKTVTVYVAQGTGFTTGVQGADVPETNGETSVTLTATRVEQVSIIFLGAPAIGKDLDSDFNDELDDEILAQCFETNDADEEVINEGICGSGESAIDPNTDATESRSKLVVRTGLPSAIGVTATPLIDGKTATHELVNATERDVTIYALLEDGEGKPLLGHDVSFSVTTTPAGIVAASKLSDDDETKAVVDTDTATRDQIFVDGLTGDTGVTTGALINANDAVAHHVIERLPTTPFNVTVEVMVGNLSLGMVEIVRTGDPAKVVAGVFNIECFNPGGTPTEPEYSTAKFDDTNDDCDDSGMANRFGAGQMIVVKAHHEDDLGLVVGDGSDLSSKLANEDDDLIGDDDVININVPVDEKDEPRAWIYMVDKDATLGEHMITVSTSATDKDGEDIDDVTVSITVAGPPHRYGVEGPMYIPLGGRGTFTVTAMDEAMDLPHFTTDGTDANDAVDVFVADVPGGNVRGLNRSGELELDPATGMGTFTVFAPRDASQGEVARIFVSSGDSEVALTVTFGETVMMMPPMELGAAMDLTATANADGSITLMFTPGTSATHHFVYGNVSAVSAVWEFADGMNMHTVSADQLVSGTEYSFYVISGRFMKADDGTWPGEWSSAGWTNVAKAMAQ